MKLCRDTCFGVSPCDNPKSGVGNGEAQVERQREGAGRERWKRAALGCALRRGERQRRGGNEGGREGGRGCWLAFDVTGPTRRATPYPRVSVRFLGKFDRLACPVPSAQCPSLQVRPSQSGNAAASFSEASHLSLKVRWGGWVG